MRFSSKEELFLASEIKNLLQKGVIEEIQQELDALKAKFSVFFFFFFFFFFFIFVLYFGINIQF